MVFSSPLFIFVFCPVFFTAYLLAPAKLKDAVIIIASIIFYTWGAYYFILVVFATCLMDYILGALIYKIRENPEKKNLYRLFIFIDVFINLGILVYFKYTNFFIENLSSLLASLNYEQPLFPKVIMPIGISFIIFQKMTYCLDIAKGTAKPAEHFFAYFEYMLIFPALIVGPILKYNILAPQFRNKAISLDNIEAGFKRFAIGLAKKVLIADTVAKYADLVFNGSAAVIPIDYTWIGLVCFTLQLYFDFSAYCDMAIGMLKIMGLSIPENFHYPFISRSITEFWTRWHISLTSWMREYIYYPLGGNRKGVARTYINLWAIFLISGFWHGAGWTYIVWGISHGCLLCLERLVLLKKMEKIPGFIRMVFTTFMAMLSLVLFRADTLAHSMEYYKQMVNLSSLAVHVPPERIMVIDNFGKFIIVLGAFICIFPFFDKSYKKLIEIKDRFPKTVLVLCFILFCVAVAKVGTASFSPFIYFQF